MTKAQQNKENKAIDKVFVYGSLNNDYHLELLTGTQLPYKNGILLNHRRIHPEKSFAFALPWRGYTIKGRMLYNVTPEILEKLDEYENEGQLYDRTIAKVKIDEEIIETYVYVGIVKAIKPYVKRGFEEKDRIEEFVEQNVDRYLDEKAGVFLDYNREALRLHVTKELLSEEVHSLLRQYFQDVGLPSFIIKHEIQKASIPRLQWLLEDRKAQKYVNQYMDLAVNFMIFNQLEEKFRNDFRYDVKVTDAYYLHTFSALMALKLLVDNNQQLQIAIRQLGLDRWEPNMVYTDYAMAAIFIAEELYSRERAQHIVDWFQRNRHIGVVTLGAELEFSNLGSQTIGAQEGDDPSFDAFYYFYDFDLMRRGWKLGAHVDDHGFLTSQNNRVRGFMELAFGRYKLLGDVSKPATQDPWVLSQIIDLAVRFFKIRPHSMHLSMGTNSLEKFNRVDNLEHYLCLLILGGDLRQDHNDQLREMRIHRGEIMSEQGDIIFSRLNRHHKNPEDDAWTFVIEYQFPRLYFEYDYQPIIMALKGFQLGANPFPFKGCKTLEDRTYIKELEEALKKWAAAPQPVSSSGINAFLSLVEQGLEKEAKMRKDLEYAKYSLRILGRIEERLKRRNKRIEQHYAARKNNNKNY